MTGYTSDAGENTQTKTDEDDEAKLYGLRKIADKRFQDINLRSIGNRIHRVVRKPTIATRRYCKS
jgi:hypothetical protein